MSLVEVILLISDPLELVNDHEMTCGGSAIASQTNIALLPLLMEN